MEINIDYLFVQVALFVLYFGFKIKLPLWVVWLPSIFVGVVLSFVGFVLLCVWLRYT